MRRIIAAILALMALMGLSAVFSPAALADGDPASDVLVYDSVFAPYDLHASADQVDQLEALIAAVTKAGYPIKVALIASETDLGTVTQLWGDPNDYGIYLGKELSAMYHGNLLVVMPQGYSLNDQVPHPPKADYTVMENVVAPGSDLIGGAYSVVDRLAKANGVAVPAKLDVKTTATTRGSSAIVPWIAFIAGLIVVAGAWGVSLRLAPLRRKVLA